MIDNQAYKYDIHEADIDLAATADIRVFLTKTKRFLDK